MNRLELQEIVCTTQKAINTIQIYISGLHPEPRDTVGSSQPNDVREWTPNDQGFPLYPDSPDYEDNIDIAVSGYTEDYRPLKEQLGPNGASWSTDYEFHTEESTKAMFQPTIVLAQDINQALNTIVDSVNSIVDAINQGQRYKIWIEYGSLGDYATYGVEPTYPDDWPQTFSYPPILTFLRRRGVSDSDLPLGSEGEYFEIDPYSGKDLFELYTIGEDQEIRWGIRPKATTGLGRQRFDGWMIVM